MERNAKYWTEKEKSALEVAVSFNDLLVIALAVLDRMPDPVAQVCGPISTGGRGSTELNLKVFDATIERLLKEGINVFDQVPFEQPMVRMRAQDKTGKYNDQLLLQFYLPLFQSGRITRFYFIHDWPSSKGASWERLQAQRLGIKIEDLPEDFVSL